MGGNARAINRADGTQMHYSGKPAAADRINLKSVGMREVLEQEILLLLHFLDDRINLWKIERNLFPPYLLYSRRELFSVTHPRIFSGSSRHVFDSTITTSELLKYVSTIGDIDVMVPHEKLNLLFSFLARIESQRITSRLTYVGQNKCSRTGHQINALFHIFDESVCLDAFVQVDFEGVEFSEGLPTEFSEFAHSSAWCDITSGLKGVAHKYILTNIVRAVSTVHGGSYLTEQSPPPPNHRISKSKKPVRTLAFSVDRGLRTKAVPVFHFGEHVRERGIFLYRELSTDESIYTRDLAQIVSAVFAAPPTPENISRIKSFVGIVSLMREFLTQTTISSAFNLMLHENLFGKSAQKLSRTESVRDRDIKLVMVNYLFAEFPFLKAEFADQVAYMSSEFEKTYHA